MSGAAPPTWSLEPGTLHLNHGSFGAVPREVQREQARLRGEMELNPMRFLARRLESRLADARARLAAFVGAEEEGLAFVQNATTAVNTVLRSLRIDPGDELLLIDHAYNACSNAAEFVAQRAGARVVRATLPFPLEDPGRAVEAILAKAGEKTRLALLDHVTSPTALVLPIDEIVAELRRRGVETLVDGAHAPGMVGLNLRRLGAGYYTGNCHKWLCAPRGSAFLYVREDLREEVRPLVISHGANAPVVDRSRFRLEFDWVGTLDPTAWLCVPTALDLLGGALPGGWPALRGRNHALAVRAGLLLSERLGAPPPAPESCLGSMFSVRLPPVPTLSESTIAGESDPLQARLREEFRIEVPVFYWPAPPHRLLRISAQLYNSLEDYRRLADALERTVGVSGE